ncbi:LysR family transcriptional regulator [Variovorax sp. J22G21]|uniref:LysR family transcriptional regulator n=1 Tax=Variovorax fucosicus TaxID=3053517 RepID=UPI0025764784|nr:MULTISPECIES: LysR family transcriptional regulator [unclassified Variovorax]MDM0040136.1 LysR family transcriptional regulator [Variovorax sp. J22R193]MDM0061509.1 LysR family transcriptional regulator [Variovorax sp. J22G21]
MNLRSIDLNLLVVLEALIEERGVRRAGERIGLSQSATSHALDRLRKLLGDEILVRTPTGMEPTARALSLFGPLRIALQSVEMALMPEQFVPAEAQGEIQIGVETHETIIILPQLVDQIRTEAPQLSLSVRPGSVDDILNGIDQGRTDIGIGFFRGLPDRFMTCALLQDSHVCVMRADHPLAAEPLTLESYLQAPHLLVSMSGAPDDFVDSALTDQGLRRRIAMRLPHGLAAVIALTRSDMVTTVTRGAARVFAQSAPLVWMELPFAVPRVGFRLIWNRRLQQSPQHRWLRQKLVAIGAAAEASGAPAQEAAPGT